MNGRIEPKGVPDYSPNAEVLHIQTFNPINRIELICFIIKVGRFCVMDFSNSKSEQLLARYDDVRRHVEIDNLAGGRYRFAGEKVKEYAERLREEMDRRRLNFTPIDWPVVRSSGDD